MNFFINPINNKGPVNPAPRAEKADKAFAAKETADKVERVVEIPVRQQSREVRLLNDAKELSRRIQKDWNLLTPSELAEQIVDLEGKVALLEGTSSAIEKIREVAQRLHFQFVFPIVLELSTVPDPRMPMSFARMVHNVAKRVLETQSWEPLKELNAMQIRGVYRQAGDGGGMSPEILSHAMKQYVDALRHQMTVAQAFFFGKLKEGMEGLLRLPEDVQIQIDQLIWDSAGGAPVDPTNKEAQGLIAACIMHSVEDRMGINEG